MQKYLLLKEMQVDNLYVIKKAQEEYLYKKSDWDVYSNVSRIYYLEKYGIPNREEGKNV